MKTIILLIGLIFLGCASKETCDKEITTLYPESKIEGYRTDCGYLYILDGKDIRFCGAGRPSTFIIVPEKHILRE